MTIKIPIYNPQNMKYEPKEVEISPTDDNFKLQVAFEWQKLYNKEKFMNNYEEQIKKLKEHIAKLEAELKESKEPKVKRWKPEKNTCYYFVNVDGDNDDAFYYWEDDAIDEYLYLTQNCFKTREEAEEHSKEIEIYFKFKNYVEEHSEPLDWNNANQDKFRCYYDFDVKDIFYSVNNFCKSQGSIFASSEQILKDAIDYIGGEEVAKRYLFGIKE